MNISQHTLVLIKNKTNVQFLTFYAVNKLVSMNF